MRIPTLLALTPFVFGGAPEAWGFGLGELHTESRLGERLQAEIDLVGDEGGRLEPSCFRLVEPTTPDIPWLSRGRVDIRRDGRRQILVVKSEQQVVEPLLQVAVRTSCVAELTRNYVVMLSPPLVRPVEELPRPAASSLMAKPIPRPGAGRWVADGETTLAALAVARYPGDAARQRKFVAAVARSNPDVFPERTAAAMMVPAAGTQLDLPRKVARQEARVEEARRVKKARWPFDAPRLVIDAMPTGRLGDAGDVDALRLKLATDTSAMSGKSISEEYRNTLRLEYKLLAALAERATTQLELSEKLRHADESLAALQQQADRVSREAAKVSVSVPQPGPMTPAVQEPAPESKPESKPESTPWYEWTFYGGMAFGLLGLAGVLAYRGRRRASLLESGLPETLPHADPAPAAVGAIAARQAVPERVGTIRTEGAGEKSAPMPEAGQGLEPLNQPTRGGAMLTEMFEATPVMELAEVMLSFGRVNGAAQALKEYVDNNPREALKPWLKLLEVYRSADMRDEFERLASKLNGNFNVEVLSWDDPHLKSGGIDMVPLEDGQRAAAAKALTLEAVPHIRDRLVKTWGSVACLDYLNHLLHDNRDGERSGFTLPVVQEILVLIDILDARLAGVHKT